MAGNAAIGSGGTIDVAGFKTTKADCGWSIP
jgi:hypothetical protein